MSLKGGRAAPARLKAIGLVFKPIGKRWADDTVKILQAPGPGQDRGMRRSVRRRNATQKKATVAAHYAEVFIEKGTKAHTITPRKAKRCRFEAGGQTVFAKKVNHPGTPPNPIAARSAQEALAKNPMAGELVESLERGRHEMVMVRVGMQAAMRAAAVAMLTAYAAGRSRPSSSRSIRAGRGASPAYGVSWTASPRRSPTPPSAREQPRAEVVVVHGLMDSKEAADQKDAFADGFIDWAQDHIHQMDPRTTIAVVGTEDDPDYVPDWQPPNEQRSYYATRITLEGYVGDN